MGYEITPTKNFVSNLLLSFSLENDISLDQEANFKLLLTSNHTSNVYSNYAFLPISLKLIPAPPKEKRILFDFNHSISYPNMHIPLDDILSFVQQKSSLESLPLPAGHDHDRSKHLSSHEISSYISPLDWYSDSLYNNFSNLRKFLKNSGYFIDQTSSSVPYSPCHYNLSSYNLLLIIDPEKSFTQNEIKNIKKSKINLALFSDWYDVDVMKKLAFYDENAMKFSSPVTGGSNLPGVNVLFEELGWPVAYRTDVVSQVSHPEEHFEGLKPDNANSLFTLQSGSLIDYEHLLQNIQSSERSKSVNFCATANSHYFNIKNYILNNDKSQIQKSGPVLAICENKKFKNKLFTFADSNLLDDSSRFQDFELLGQMLKWSESGDLGEFRFEKEVLFSSTDDISTTDVGNDTIEEQTESPSSTCPPKTKFKLANTTNLPSSTLPTQNNYSFIEKFHFPTLSFESRKLSQESLSKMLFENNENLNHDENSNLYYKSKFLYQKFKNIDDSKIYYLLQMSIIIFIIFILSYWKVFKKIRRCVSRRPGNRVSVGIGLQGMR